MIQVDNKNILNALVHHDEGEIALVLDEQKTYQYKENEWVEYIPEGGELNMTVYELNQQTIPQLPTLDEQGIQNAINVIDQYTEPCSYYMLLCRDMNYYTLFITGNAESNESVGEALIDCFQSMHADLKAVDLTDDGVAIEIWFVLPEANKALCAYLFLYDEGVILCK